MATPSAAAAAMAMAVDAPLAHIRQRIDALVYDNDHTQFLLGSLQHADALTTSAHRRNGTSTNNHTRTASHRTSTMMMNHLGVAIQRRRIRGTGRWARVVGVTPHYVAFALFVGLGWLVQALGVFAYAFAFADIIGKEPVTGARTDRIQIGSKVQSYVALSFFFVAEAVGAIGFGACADHYGRRRVLLAALALAWLGDALVPAAQSYAMLLAARLTAGLGRGGQSALLITIALEFSPKRTRGRILVLSQLLGGVGVVLAAVIAKVVTPWRYSFVVLAVVGAVVGALFAWRLRESPTYLASIGRLDQALVVLQSMETAHGIDRHARVTVPSSLYAPPALQQQQQQQQRQQRSSTRTADGRAVPFGTSAATYALKDDDGDGDSDELAPLPHRATSRRGTVETIAAFETDRYSAPPTSGNVGRPRASTDRHAAASPAMVSFSVSSTKRFAVLFQSQYVRATLSLWLLWLLLSTAFGAAATCVLRRLEAIDHAPVGSYVLIGVMTLPGLALSAVLVEQLGRKVALAALVCASAVLMFVVGACLSTSATSAPASSLVIAVAGLALCSAGAFAALCVYTGEQYALMVRAMGIAWALAWGHVGSFVGVHVVLSHWAITVPRGHQIVLWVAGAACFIVVVGVLAVGTETQGVDIDIIEPLKPAPIKRDTIRDANSSDPTDEWLDAGGAGGSHRHPMADKFRVQYMAHEPLATVLSSPSGCESNASDASSSDLSSSSSRFASSQHWRKHVRAFAAAAAAAVPLRKSAAAAAAKRKQSTRSTIYSDSCGDLDLDQLDAIVTDSEGQTAAYVRRYSQRHDKRSRGGRSSSAAIDGPQRKRTAASDASEPALLDWRPSNPNSDDDGSDDRDEAAMRAIGGGGYDRSDSETDKFSIDVDAFDRYSSLSTPMLEGSPQLSFER